MECKDSFLSVMCITLRGWIGAEMFLPKAFVAGMMTVFIAGTILFSAVPCYSQTFLVGTGRNPRVDYSPQLPLRIYFRFQADGETISSPIVADGRVFFGCRDHYVYAVSSLDGTLLWRFRTLAPVDATPTVSNGIVYIGSHDGNFYAIRADNGRLWFRHPAGSPISSSALVTGGRVYFSTETSQELRCLDAAGGELLWQVQLQQPSQSSPTLAGETIIVGDNSGRLYGFDPLNGSPRFTFATNGSCGFGTATVEGSEIYFAPGILDRNLYALDFAGNPLWTYSGGPTGINPAPSSDIRLGFSHQQRLRNLDKTLASGTAAPGLNPSPGRPAFFLSWVDPSLLYNSQGVVSDGSRIYYCTGYPTARLVAVDIATRAMSWNLVLGDFPVPVGHYGVPVLTTAGLIVTDSMGNLLVIDKETGAVLENKPISTPSFGTPAVTAEQIFCLTHTGQLVCLVSGPDPTRTDDLIPPLIQVIEPAENSTVYESRPRLQVQLSDDGTGLNPNSFVLKMDGQTTAVEFNPLLQQLTGLLPPLSDGSHHLELTVDDIAGNRANCSWDFSIQAVSVDDRLPPGLSGQQPPPGTTVRFNRRPEISGILTDAGGSGLDLREIRLFLDGKPLIHHFDPTTGRVSGWPLDPLEDGLHHVSLDAWDLAGNPMRTERWDFQVLFEPDGESPGIDFLEPGTGATITRTRLPRLVFQVTDSQSGIDPHALILRLDGVQLNPEWNPLAAQLSAIPDAPLSDGTHRLELFASDLVGNTITGSWDFQMSWQIGSGRIRASLTGDGALISWTTEQAATGRVEISQTEDFLETISFNDLRGAEYRGQCHAVAVTGQAPGTRLWFRVISAVDVVEETVTEGIPTCSFQSVTAGNQPPFPLQGQVLRDAQTVADVLVYLSASTGRDTYSLPLTTLSESDGRFHFDLAELTGEDGNPLILNPGMQIRLFVQGADAGLGWQSLILPDPLPSSLDSGMIALESTMTWQYSMLPGLNLTGIALDPIPDITSHDLLNSWSGLLEVARYIPASHTFSVAARLFDTPAGEDFPLLCGSGCYLHFLLEEVFSITGTPENSPIRIPLQNGLNLVSFPFAVEGPDRPVLGMNAFDLLEQFPQINEVFLFDSMLQRFVSAVFRLESGIKGNNFPFTQNQAYFVHAVGDTTITPVVKHRFQPLSPTAGAPQLKRMAALTGHPRILQARTVNFTPTGFDVAILLDRPTRARIETEGGTFYPGAGQNHIASQCLIPVVMTGNDPLTLVVGDGEQVSSQILPAPVPVIRGHGNPQILTGRMLNPASVPLAGRIVIIRIRADGEDCLDLATLTDNDGCWFVNLAGLYGPDGSNRSVTAQKQAAVFILHRDDPQPIDLPLTNDSPQDCGDLYFTGGDEQ